MASGDVTGARRLYSEMAASGAPLAMQADALAMLAATHGLRHEAGIEVRPPCGLCACLRPAIRCIGGVCRPESQNCSQPLQLSPRPARGNHDLKPHIINHQQQLSLVVVAVRRILQQIWPLCLSWMLQPSASWRTRQLLPQRDHCARTSHLAEAHLRLQQQQMVSLVHVGPPCLLAPDRSGVVEADREMLDVGQPYK